MDVVDVALMVAAALDAVGAEYFVGGSVASSLQGEPRATNDIDMVVALPVRRVAAFAEALGSEFEVDQDGQRGAGARRLREHLLPAEMSVAYLDSWAPRLGLTGLLARARAEAKT